MAMGTTPTSQPNPQMHPSGATPSPGIAPGVPGATPHSTEPRDASKPWLDPDDDKVDWVLLMRCYPHAKTKDDLRAAALKAGAEAEKAAEAAKAAKDVPASEQAGEGAPAPPPAAHPPQPQHA